MHAHFILRRVHAQIGYIADIIISPPPDLEMSQANYFLFEQACPDDGVSFRQVQCSDFNDIPYKGNKYEWIPVATPGTSSSIPRHSIETCFIQNQSFWEKVLHSKRVILSESVSWKTHHSVRKKITCKMCHCVRMIFMQNVSFCQKVFHTKRVILLENVSCKMCHSVSNCFIKIRAIMSDVLHAKRVVLSESV